MNWLVYFYGPDGLAICDPIGGRGPLSAAEVHLRRPPQGAVRGAVFLEVDICCGLTEHREVYATAY